MVLFFGLDLSTQSLKATITTEWDVVIFEKALVFQRDLPHHGTTNGAIAGPEDGEMTCPVALWIESLDRVMDAVAAAGVDMREIVAVSGAAQQHGSVYWSKSSTSLLRELDASRSLLDQLVPSAFSLPNAPTWQDSSTSTECRQLEEALGGPQVLANLSGSRAYERFTASQIMKVRTKRPESYRATLRISMVSSFLASLFLAHFAPIEVADASGMNLMSLSSRKWDTNLLHVVSGGNADDLRSKLSGTSGDVGPALGGEVLGTIGKWWVERYKFSEECIVAPFTGDNPSTIVALSSPGDAILSLGTSTTLLVSIPPSKLPDGSSAAPTCSTSSHILAHPTTEGGFIYMLCYKNGGLTRELVQQTYSSSSWDKFNSQVTLTSPGSLIAFYFTLKEIIPDGVQGEYFFRSGEKIGLDEVNEVEHARAVLESQIMSVRVRLEDTLQSTISSSLPAGTTTSSTEEKPTFVEAAGLKRCILTGGSSSSHTIQQIVADILGLPVFVASNSASAASGGALLAKYAWWKAMKGHENGTFEEMRKDYGELTLECVARPHDELVKIYKGVVDSYRRCEEEVVHEYRTNTRSHDR